MKKDKDLLKRCLQELERVNGIFPGLPQKSLIDGVSDYLSRALVPDLADDLTWIKPGDLCEICGDMATEERYTHWSYYKFCSCCVRVYDITTGDGKKLMDGYLIAEQGSDPFEVV